MPQDEGRVLRLMMKRVLVSGATGFIGRHCLELLLKRGYEVHAVTARSITGESSDLQWHRADLTDPLQVKKLLQKAAPEELLHLAWYVAPGSCWGSMENIRWVEASLQLVREFIDGGGRRLVVSGSCAEYDWRYGYCSEHLTPTRPGSLYGAGKHALQVLVDALVKEGSLSAAWGRIFYLYGPHEHPQRLVPSVITSLLRGEPARCSHGNQLRDFLYVKDVAAALVALLESDFQGPVNIASGQAVTLKTIINTIADRLDGAGLLRLGARPVPEGEPAVLLADTRLLREKVGWEPAYTLEQGLEETIGWWKEQLG